MRLRNPAVPARVALAAFLGFVSSAATAGDSHPGRILAAFENTTGAAAQVSEDDRPKLAALPKLFEALGAKPGARIADVGSGDGFYSLQISREVGPAGRVTASDISQGALDRLRSHMETEKIANVYIVLGRPDDPLLPAGAFDAVLIRNAYHEMVEHEAILRHIHDALKASGRLVLVEPFREERRGKTRAEQTAVHEISSDIAASELVTAGFVIEKRDESFEPFLVKENPGGYWLLVATPARK